MSKKEKISRANASQFFVAGELCRNGYFAVVTLGNTPNTDILCSNIEGTKVVNIQVKTFVPGIRTCSVGKKAEYNFGKNFIWVLAGIPKPGTNKNFEYYIIPSNVMARNVTKSHQKWLKSPGRKGQPHKDSSVRTVDLPPFKSRYGWDIKRYRNRWDLIEKKLRA